MISSCCEATEWNLNRNQSISSQQKLKLLNSMIGNWSKEQLLYLFKIVWLNYQLKSSFIFPYQIIKGWSFSKVINEEILVIGCFVSQHTGRHCLLCSVLSDSSEYSWQSLQISINRFYDPITEVVNIAFIVRVD